MPPPAPHNLNKWFIGGTVVLVAVGLFTSMKHKREGIGPFAIEKDVPLAIDGGAAGDATDAARE